MLKKFIFTFFFIFLCLSKNSLCLETDWEGINEAKVRIISPFSNTNFDNSIIVGLEYNLEENWKTYWKSPGAGGFPQEIDYSSSTNVKNIKIYWPTPEQFSILDLDSLGYKNTVIFPIKVNIVDKLKSVNLDLKIHFLTCNKICIPVDVKLNLTIPFGEIAEITKHANLIEKYISLSPSKKVNDYNVKINDAKFFINGDDALLEFDISQKKPFNNPKIFIDSEKGLPIVDPILKLNESRNLLNVKFFYNDTFIDISKKNLNIHISDFPFVHEEQINFNVLNEKIDNFYNNGFFKIVIIALLGGLILNVMPCVLPILSLKLLSITDYSGQDKFFIRLGFIYTSIGIIFSYALLALILIGIKFSGKSISWGMQFQQPFFLMFISVILLLFSYNLMDFYEIRLPFFSNKSQKKTIFKKSYSSDFFSGFFATLMATPCSAPFVGTAVTFAFTQQSLLLILTFIFMGIGMALPYIIIATFPQMINFLPKPGNWMIWIRRLLAVLLLITLWWVGTIISNHFNHQFILISIFLGLLILVIFLLSRKNYIFNKNIFFIVSIITLFYFILPSLGNFEKISIKENNKWINFDVTSIENLLKDKKIVFVDITADWCITCQYNKQNVINTKEIQEIFKKYQVVKIQGDWTLPDENIEKFLNKYNKFGIPFNILYTPKRYEGIIMPELLTKEILIDTLNETAKE